MIIQTTRVVSEALEQRGADDWGSGAWGSSRGSRPHRGIDYLSAPGATLFSPAAGVVTRFGTCYADDPTFRYVQIGLSNDPGYQMRVMYIEPSPALELGSDVIKDLTSLGVVQNVSGRYHDANKRPMGNHVHVEIRRRIEDGGEIDNGDNVYGQWEYYNPDSLLLS